MPVWPQLTTRRRALTSPCRGVGLGDAAALARHLLRRDVPPHGGRGRAVAHQTPRRAARWRVRAARQGTRLGTNRAPARLTRTGRITVARTGVLIKTASHPARTCVLITCMSQARYGPRPRSDVIPWCRQNGHGDPSGTVGHPVTCHNRRDAAAESRRLDGEARHPGVAVARHRCVAAARHPRVRGVRCPPGGRVRSTARVGAAAADPRLPRSLLAPQSRQRAPADGSARPRLTNARAPC
jgi:hypothetical protein